MIYRIHVSGSVLRRNASTGRSDPPIIVRERQTSAESWRFKMAQGVHGVGSFRVVHERGRVWLEASGPISLAGAVDGLDPDQPEPPT